MGRIFDIQRGCTDDGPGIRTTVFFKGCPLNCLWCHNPESKSFEKQEYLDKSKIVGKDITAEEVMDIVLSDKKYYEVSGGGMTISGGEPLMQPEFACDLLKLAKEQGIHTCVETSGFAKQKVLEQIMPYTDIFLFDIKAPHCTHKELTGVNNDLIMSNFEYLYEKRARLIVRCPIIPEKNDNDEHFAYLKRIKKEHPELLDMQIMPYHNMGNSKARRMGLDVLFETENPTHQQIEIWRKQI